MNQQYKNNSLGTRMKSYERSIGNVLIPRMPTIIRVDGKAFHTFTKRINVKNDLTSEYGPSQKMHDVMNYTAEALMDKIQNAVFAYTQSDEISILLRDWDTFETQQWYGGKVQKVNSVSAAIATAAFNFFWAGHFGSAKYVDDLALFDSRVFQVPKEDVTNYFIWRQQDATRNSVNFIARKHFSHKELQGKNTNEVQEMLWQEHDCNWNDYATWKKRGSCIVKNTPELSNWIIDDEIPVFTQDREYVEKRLEAAGK